MRSSHGSDRGGGLAARWWAAPIMGALVACSGSQGTAAAGDLGKGGAQSSVDAGEKDAAGSRDAGTVNPTYSPTDAAGVDAASAEDAPGAPGGQEAGAADLGPSDAFVCLQRGVACEPAGVPCCADTCFRGACGGCVVEGAQPGPGTSCCEGLVATDAGFCGTAACVPDGTPCGGGGVVCCNDNCDGVKCGGQ